jgi:hypothetical protein
MPDHSADPSAHPSASPTAPVVPGSLLEVFLAFARVSIFSFGGVLPWARRSWSSKSAG